MKRKIITLNSVRVVYFIVSATTLNDIAAGARRNVRNSVGTGDHTGAKLMQTGVALRSGKCDLSPPTGS